MQLPMLLRLSPLLQCPSLTPTLVWSGLVGLGFSVSSLSLLVLGIPIGEGEVTCCSPFFDDACRRRRRITILQRRCLKTCAEGHRGSVGAFQCKNP